MDLKKKIVIITGGAGLLGSEFAKSIIEFNGIPIILDNDVKALTKLKNFFKKKKLKIDFFECDLLNEKNLIKISKDLIKKYKKIDCLINTASQTKSSMENEKHYDFFEDFEKYNLKTFQKSIEYNLSSIFLTNKIFGTLMKKNRSGSIINIASDVGVVSPDHRIYKKNIKLNYKGVNFNTPLSYAMSKAAIINLTKYLSTYWAPYNIRVNSISPSGISNNHDKKFVEMLSNRIPLNRMANKNEINGAIIFLCSHYSSYITGHNLIIDGGKTAW